MTSTSENPDASSDNHSLIPCTEVKWIRNIGRKVTGSNVYYSIEGEATRLKSFNEIERYYSDFATNRDDRVSMGGFITFIDETPISWRTFKQKSVSLSTMEAEYVSLTEAAKEFIWLKNVIDNKSLNLELSENVIFLSFFLSPHKLQQIPMMSSDAVRINLNECMQKYDEYSERFFALLPVFGKKAVLEWCLKEGLIASSYVCPKSGKPMELRERTGKSVNDGFEWMCRNQSSVKEENHYVSRSVRKGSWFQLSNMDMCTVLLVMRKWFGRCPQKYAVADLGVGSHTAVDWYNFCRNTTHRTEDMFDSYLHDFMW
ncbi:retrovirus-related Pol polyprotein from transposon TNT 1-94 [Trichonephila clavipes]|uniref:Retrovirus-related Pol polyprotein from transposon TNT 1-94 n=1 Tax=Trichonephila clavipes TaxID=2585209 RepID=A0A8X6S3X2_TRICX|nr:retrovirus-related Pol polyprotein from transposon TNT 1-94 [Trichonephila clavipes]